jgi:pyruvate/2-oxoglutarate dehydrogenase complex dihydrolipoamide acyltransferase (E2) component
LAKEVVKAEHKGMFFQLYPGRIFDSYPGGASMISQMAENNQSPDVEEREDEAVTPEELAEQLNAPETDQDQALLDYRVSGINKGYVDPSRDQEPDIAPEFGSAPHPELFNPDASQLGSIGAQPSNDPRTELEEDRDLPEDPEKNAETQSVGDGTEPGTGEESVPDFSEGEATEAAEARAADLGVDVSEVEGSGKDGRVTVGDVERHAAERS